MKSLKNINNFFQYNGIYLDNEINGKLNLQITNETHNSIKFKIIFDNEELNNIFDVLMDFGIKTFGQYIINTKNFNINYNEKLKTLEIIKFDNTLILTAKLI